MDLDRIFDLHPPDAEQQERMALLRDLSKRMAEVVVELTPPCAEQDRAVALLDRALREAIAAIARGPEAAAVPALVPDPPPTLDAALALALSG